MSEPVRPFETNAAPTLRLADVERLYPRYSGPGPRYTSYPTVPVWSDAFGPQDHEAALRAIDPSEELSVYAHVPFCHSLCHFCACNRVITRDPEVPERYLDAIDRELATVAAKIEGRPRVGQLHWGGGTPTHLDPGQLERLFDSIASRVEILGDAELSVEVDPRVTSEDQIETLARLGFNRLSLGVQDTDRKTQEAIHRIQPFEQTLALTETARARGITGINYDLVYGLPHQTVASMRRTLDEVLSARPDRIALYGYAHVTWVAKQQRGFERGDLPDPSRRLALFLEASGRLLDAGYRWIGMDHFALEDDALTHALDDGTLRRNFMGYTTRVGTDVLAFGPSAISQLGDAYVQAEKDLGDWTAAANDGRLPTALGHRLTPDDVARRHLIEQIMCMGRVEANDLRERFGSDFHAGYLRELERLAPLVEDGLVEISPTGDLLVLPIGRVFLRNVAMAFDAHLARDEDAPGRLFSQTV